MDISKIIEYSNVLAEQAISSFKDLPDINSIEVPELSKIEDLIYKVKTLSDYQGMVDDSKVNVMRNVMAPQPGQGGNSSTLPSNAQTQNVDLRKAISESIAEQESTNNYNVVGTLGALGKYQVMPSNLTNDVEDNWGRKAVGRLVSPEEFLNSPELQEKIFQYQFFKYFDTAKAKNLSDEDSIRYASASWYNTERSDRIRDGKFVNIVNSQIDDNKIYNGKSIKQYSNDIIQKVNKRVNVPAVPQVEANQEGGFPVGDLNNLQDMSSAIENNGNKSLADYHFANQGKSVDFDNYGFDQGGGYLVYGQCVDYIRKYAKDIGKEVGGSKGIMYAHQYTSTKDGNDMMALNWNPVKLEDTKPGDIFTQSPSQVKNTAGHIGIVLTKPNRDGWFLVSDQNASDSEGEVSTHTLNIKNISGMWTPR